MEAIKINGTLQEKTSKSGNKYWCIEIPLTSSYTKTVFLEQADVEIIRLALLKNSEVRTNE